METPLRLGEAAWRDAAVGSETAPGGAHYGTEGQHQVRDSHR